MKKSLQLIITSNGVRTRNGLKPHLILREKNNGNLELFEFDHRTKMPRHIKYFKENMIKDGKYSFWYTIQSEIRHTLEFENRRGKLVGFDIFVNREKHLEMKPIFRRYDET